MICRIEDLKKISQILLMAVDTSDTSRLTENLELKVSDGVLTLSVTNGEYLVKARISIFENIDFHATVNAELFLKLVSKITTETVEFTLKENSLVIIGMVNIEFLLFMRTIIFSPFLKFKLRM